MGSCFSGEEEPQQQAERPKRVKTDAQSTGAGNGGGRSKTTSVAIGSGGGGEDADLVSNLGTSFTDRRDAEDMIKQSMMGGSGEEALKQIVEGATEKFIDVTQQPHFLEKDEILHRHEGYSQQVHSLVSVDFPLLSLPAPSAGNHDHLRLLA